jgi:hypothetical protein
MADLVASYWWALLAAVALAAVVMYRFRRPSRQ